jgi:putative transposase
VRNLLKRRCLAFSESLTGTGLQVRDRYRTRKVGVSWQEFLKRHAETLYQCDFFSKRIWTRLGLQQFFVLVFLHIGSRKVFVTKCTNKPTAAWMTEQAEMFVAHSKSEGKPATFLYRDRDGVYAKTFDSTLKAAGIEVRMNPPRSPNLQAHVERFIQSLQHEALDHFVVFGEKHFDFLISEYVEHYHTERPHQGMGNVVLSGKAPMESEPPEAFVVSVNVLVVGCSKSIMTDLCDSRSIGKYAMTQRGRWRTRLPPRVT